MRQPLRRHDEVGRRHCCAGSCDFSQIGVPAPRAMNLGRFETRDGEVPADSTVSASLMADSLAGGNMHSVTWGKPGRRSTKRPWRASARGAPCDRGIRRELLGLQRDARLRRSLDDGHHTHRVATDQEEVVARAEVADAEGLAPRPREQLLHRRARRDEVRTQPCSELLCGPDALDRRGAVRGTSAVPPRSRSRRVAARRQPPRSRRASRGGART